MEHEKNNEELMYIDLFALLRKTMLFLRRFWAMVLALSVLGGGVMYIRSVRAYRPMYKSEAMFSVSVHYSGNTDITGYSYYYDKAAAKLVTETFPYLLQSESTQELIRQKLGVSYINGSISSSSVADTNLFALTVTSPSAQDAYDIINAVMEVYPQVSRQVIGETQLVITREPLLSFAPYNTLSWKHSVIKGAAAGFLLGMGLLVLMAISRRTVLSTGDVKKISNLSCLARIPEVRVKRRKLSTNNSLLVTRQESDSPFNESFRLLRLKLLRSLSKNDQVILFTSSVPAEGKSSLAVNTALTLAKDNKKVLLVDADLRGPSIKSLLNINKSSNGLGEYLSGGLDTVQFVRYENTKLFVFSGDEPISNPTPLFQRDKLAAFIQSVRPMFDYILIDTPPCSMMADASALSSHVDKVVYVIREDYASTSQILDGIQTLSGSGAEICGFVFNRASAVHGSGYGYGYGYGYGHGRYGYGYHKKGYGYGYGRDKAKAEEGSKE